MSKNQDICTPLRNRPGLQGGAMTMTMRPEQMAFSIQRDIESEEDNTLDCSSTSFNSKNRRQCMESIPGRMSSELRCLSFWRAVIAECLAAFFYVFLLAGVSISWTGSLLAHSPQLLLIGLMTGCVMIGLQGAFGTISAGLVNPAVSIALATTGRISPLRGVAYSLAQAAGSIAGSALLYG